MPADARRDRRSFLSLGDLPGDRLPNLLARAAHDKRHGVDPALLAGKSVALLFLNPSLRTRTSMELAAHSLGAHAVVLTPGAGTWQVETRRGVVMDGDAPEHLVDAVRVLGEMVDLIGVRTFAGLRDLAEDRAEPILSLISAESPVPVVNLESAMDHPLQALADLMTLQAHLGDDLTGVPVTLTWAPHPKPLPLAVAAAFLRGAARMGMDVRVAAPDDFALPRFLIDEARAIGPRAKITVFDDQKAALAGTRAVYAKSWAAPELLHARDADLVARAGRRDWTVSEERMDLTDDALFLHCLPVRRNVVVDDAVIDGPRSVVVEQAGNRLHTARAVLAHSLSEDLA